MCEWLESQMDRCLYSVSELREQLLVSGFKENDVYSLKTLKMKLEEHYKDHVVFGEHSGRTDVVCLRKMTSSILRDLWQKELDSDDDVTESERVVKAAAKPHQSRNPCVR